MRDFLRSMIRYEPVVEIVNSKAGREYCDGEIIELPGVLQDHADPVPDGGPLGVDLVLHLVQLKGDDGKDDGVLNDRAEHHEDAGHDESVDGVEFWEPRWRGIGSDAVENVDKD